MARTNTLKFSLFSFFVCSLVLTLGHVSSAYAQATVINENSALEIATAFTLPVGTNLLAGASINPTTTNSNEGSNPNWSALVDGVLGANADKTVSVTPPNNAVVTFTLNTSVNTLGYNISSFDFYCAWPDGGRNDIDLVISYSKVSDPSTFIFYATVGNHNGNPASHTRLTDSTATQPYNVGAIRFTIGSNQENGYVGLREFVALGTPATSTVAAPGVNVISVNFQSANNGGSTAILSNEISGLIPVTDWNNLLSGTDTSGSAAVNFSTGGITGRTQGVQTPSGATVAWNASNTWADGNDNSPNEKLFHGYLDDADGVNRFSKAIITNIPFTKYDVYIFHHSDDGDGHRHGDYFAVPANDPGLPAYNSAGFKFGQQTHVYSPTLGDGAGSYGNTIYMGSFTSNVLTIYPNDNNGDRNTQRAPFNGFQIIDTSVAIASVTPAGGAPAGGNVVTITGRNFTSGASFAFGANNATGVTFVDAQHYQVTVPAGTGTVNVVYTNGTDTATLTNGYLYSATPPPTISSVSPATGPTAGGTAITITGTNFRAPATVDFGGQNGMTVVSVTGLTPTNGGTTLTLNTPAAAPAGSSGFTTIKVTDTDTGGNFSLANAFKYTLNPTITSITPNTGAYNVSTPVTIVGTGFAANFAAGVGTVTVGGQALTGVVVTSTQITGTVQPMTNTQINPNDVVVTNPGGFVSTGGTALFTYTGLRVPENDTGFQNQVYYRYFHSGTTATNALLPLNGTNPVIPLSFPAPDTTPVKTGFTNVMEFGGNGGTANPFLPDGVAQFNGDGTWQTDNFAVEYWGFLNVPNDGLWTLSTGSDDASFFILGDANSFDVVASNNFAQGTTFRSGTRALKKGRHRFIVQFAEGGGGANLAVHWSGPGVPDQAIPQGTADGTGPGFYGETPVALTSAIPTPSGQLPLNGGSRPLTVTGTGLGSYVRNLVISDSSSATIANLTYPFPAAGGFTVPNATTINGFNAPAATAGGNATVTITTVAGQTVTLPGGLPNGLNYALSSPVVLLSNSTTAGSTAPATGSSSGNLPTAFVTLTASGSGGTFTPLGVKVKIDAGYNGFGTIASAGTTVSGTGSNFTAQIQAGDTLVAATQSVTVQTVTNANTLITTTAFNPVLAAGTTYTLLKAGTTVDPTHVKFVAPPHTTGPASISIINGDGQASTNTLTNEYTYVAPVPTAVAISPTNSNLTVGGNTVTVTGTNFGPTTTISFGANAGTQVVINSNTTLTAVVPASTGAAIGAVNVVTSDNQTPVGTGTLTNGYTYINRVADTPAATIAGVTAKFYLNGGAHIPTDPPNVNTAVFDALPPVKGIRINPAINANIMTGPISDAEVGTIGNGTILTRIQDTLGAGASNFYAKVNGYINITSAGSYTFSIASDDGSYFIIGNSVVVANNPGGGQGVTPLSGTVGLGAGLQKFTILYGQGGGGYGLSLKYSGPDNANTLGFVPDAVLFSDAPVATLTSINPSSGSIGGNTLVTATGTNYTAGTTVFVNGAPAVNVNFVSATSLTFRTPSGNAGAVNVVVLKTNGTADTLVGGFTFDNSARVPEYATVAGSPVVQGTYFRYHEGNGSNNNNYPSLAQLKVGAVPTAEYLPENTITYPVNGSTGGNNFSLEYTGYILIPTDDTYSFYTASDDGTLMFIGGTRVVFNDFPQGITTRSGNTIHLAPGLHQYTLQFAEGGGGYGNYVGWGNAGGSIPLDPNAVGDNGTSHGGQPTTRIPAANYYYVPPTWQAAGSGNWSNPANWVGTIYTSTSAGLQAFAPTQTTNADDGAVDTVFRFNGNGTAPFTAINDSINNTPLYVMEFNSNVNGNIISGNTLKTLGAAAFVKYQGITVPTLIQNGSGTLDIQAPIFNRDTLVLSGNGTGIVTLSGTQTQQLSGSDIKNIIKNGTSIYTITGNASTYGSDPNNGFVQIDGGTLGISGNFGTSAAVKPFAKVGTNGTAGTMRGTGNFAGAVTVGANGIIFPGAVTSTSTTGTFGNLTVGSANFSTGGTLLIRASSAGGPAGTFTSDKLTFSTPSATLGGTSKLNIHLQLKAGTNNYATPQDTLFLDLGATGSSPVTTNSFSSVKIDTVTGLDQSVPGLHLLAVDNTFTPGGSTGIQLDYDAGTKAVVGGAGGNANRVFLRLTGSVTPVTLDSVTASAEGAGVGVEFKLASELQNAGFNIYRRVVEGGIAGDWIKANASMIAGRITNPSPKTYRFYDWAPAGSYEYRVEAIDSVSGRSEYFSQSTPAVTVDGLVDVAKFVSSEMLATVAGGLNDELAAAHGLELSRAFASAGNAGDTARNLAPGKLVIARNASGEPLMTATLKDLTAAQPRNASVAAADGMDIVSRSESNVAMSLPATPRFLPKAGSTGSQVAVKVLYGDSGVLFVPSADLPAGFNINKLRIQREGRTLSALAVTPTGLVMFGSGYTDDYTDKDALFLTASTAPTLAGTRTAAQGLFDTAIVAQASAGDSSTTQFRDMYYDWSLRPYDYPPYFSSQYLSQGSTQSFAISAPSAGAGAATITLNVWSLTATQGASPDHALQAFVNGTPVGQAVWTGGGKFVALTFEVPAGTLTNGLNTVVIVTPELAGVSSQIALLHSITATYVKELAGPGSVTVNHTAQAAQTYEVSRMATSDLWVVDARFADRAALVPYESQAQADGTFKARFTAQPGGTGTYLVVPVGSELRPLSVTKTSLKPVRSGTTYLITGPSQFGAPVQNLITARNKQGLKTTFVDQEQLFDYYNYGRYGPNGIRNAVRSLQPKYLLLMGGTTYDYHNYSGANVDPMCPTFLVPTSFWSQSLSDSMFGDLGRGYSEVSVGRLPVNTPADATMAVRRILSFSGVPASGWRGMITADAFDANVADFAASSDSIMNSNPSITWTRNYLGVTAQTSAEVTQTMCQGACGGADVMVYNGHGSASRLGLKVPRILDADRVQAWTGNTVFIAATCTFNWFAVNESGYRTIALQGLVQPQGGMAATISSTTYMNADAGADFAGQLIVNAQNAGSNARWGDVLRQTQFWAYQRAQTLGNTGGWYLDLSRTESILGDPAMPIHAKGTSSTQAPQDTTPPQNTQPPQTGSF